MFKFKTYLILDEVHKLLKDNISVKGQCVWLVYHSLKRMKKSSILEQGGESEPWHIEC